MRRKVQNILFAFLIFSLFFLQKSFAFDEVRPLPYTIPLSSSGTNQPTAKLPKEFVGVSIEEKLGSAIDLDLDFINQDEKNITLRDLVREGKPLLLSLNYNRCASLCAIQLINLAKAMNETGWKIGENFRAVSVSFDPTDTPALAKVRQQEYLTLAGQKEGDWSFLVGNEKNIGLLTNALGFFYKYDKDTNEFAHSAALFFISPEGKISRYLYGITFKPLDIKFSLMTAADNKIGSPTEKVLLTCFHYNPAAGKYEAFAIGLLRVAASVTVLLVVLVIILFMWRDKRLKSRGNKT